MREEEEEEKRKKDIIIPRNILQPGRASFSIIIQHQPLCLYLLPSASASTLPFTSVPPALEIEIEIHFLSFPSLIFHFPSFFIFFFFFFFFFFSFFLHILQAQRSSFHINYSVISYFRSVSFFSFFSFFPFILRLLFLGGGVNASPRFATLGNAWQRFANSLILHFNTMKLKKKKTWRTKREF